MTLPDFQLPPSIMQENTSELGRVVIYGSHGGLSHMAGSVWPRVCCYLQKELQELAGSCSVCPWLGRES